ncbi:MAG: hypothetical protein QG591_1312 [Planctomycetota bacterium]|nr:hypothetical protein [Planctomycetota bacterium]
MAELLLVRHRLIIVLKLFLTISIKTSWENINYDINILLMEEMKVYTLLYYHAKQVICVKYLHHTIFFQKGPL